MGDTSLSEARNGQNRIGDCYRLTDRAGQAGERELTPGGAAKAACQTPGF